jgi:hypothetical protein
MSATWPLVAKSRWLGHVARASMQGRTVQVDQAPAQDIEEPAQPAQGAGRTADVDAAIAALVRLLARQAAREHLERLANPDAEGDHR